MSRINFNTFQEASLYSKNLALCLRSAVKIHKGDHGWWVEDPNQNQEESKFYSTEKVDLDQYYQTRLESELLRQGYDSENNEYVVRMLDGLIENSVHRSIILNYWTWLRQLATGRIEPVNDVQKNLLSMLNLKI